MRTPARWEETTLKKIVAASESIRDALHKLGLKGAGGNYKQFEFYIQKYGIETAHLKGHSWAKGKNIPKKEIYSLNEVLRKDSHFNLFRLKKRLFRLGLKKAMCEECGWAKVSEDGRIPIELDHINGDHFDNRLENLRILCPNCHSLKPTHRGKNKARRQGDGIGRHIGLKIRRGP